DVRGRDAEPGGAELHLPRRLLAGDVEDGPLPDRAREPLQRREEERALADAGVAAEEHERARDDAAAQHAVELADAGADARLLARLHLVERDRPHAALDRAEAAATRCARRRGSDLLLQRVPLPARRALTEPLGRGVAALGAGVDGARLE